MKWLIAGLTILLLVLQVHLWIGSGSFSEVWQLHRAIGAQQAENASLSERNQALAADVNDLKHGLDAIEERARLELGMIKEDETFFRVVER